MIERDRVGESYGEAELVALGKHAGLRVEVEDDGSATDVGARNPDRTTTGVLRPACAWWAGWAGGGRARNRGERDVGATDTDRGRELEVDWIVAVVAGEAVVGALVVGERQGATGLDGCPVGRNGSSGWSRLRVAGGIDHRAVVVTGVRRTSAGRKLACLGGMSARRHN